MKLLKYISMLALVMFGLQSIAIANHHEKDKDGEIIATLNAINSQEIKEADLALKKSANDKIKDFATQMKHDHHESLSKTEALSKSIHVEPQETHRVSHMKENSQKEYDKLEKLNGHHFEVAYVDDMIKDHEKALKFLDRAIKKAENASLKNHLMKVRETVQLHLEHAKALRKEI